jgi:CubicO group peptidase (beta-lactamase class C family)
MRRLLAITVLACFALCRPPGSCADEESTTRRDTEALKGLDAFIEATMAEWKVPGLAVAVVKDGKVIHSSGYGQRDLEKKLPVSEKTLFAIGSISKSFTVTGLAMLADQGKLDWDQPVRIKLPEFQLEDRAGNESATPRDLVSHRTGLPRHDLLWYGSGLSRRELLDRVRLLEPNREFRAVWQYNNLMYLAAGCLQERITGQSWEENTRERIFRPLVMEASNFSVAATQQSNDFALPYVKRGETIKRIPFYNLDAIAPAGSINSNVEEMIRYVRFHLDKGHFGDAQLLSRGMAEQMQTPQMVVADVETGPLHAPSFEELGHTQYGLGFFISNYRGHKLVWHSGSIDGFSALLSMIPSKRIGLIVVTNLSGNRPVPICVTRNILDRLLGLAPVDWVARAKELDKKAEKNRAEAKAKSRTERKPGTAPSHALGDYEGRYEHPAYGLVRVTSDSELLSLSWRGSQAPLKHRHYDLFETDVPEEDDSDNKIPNVSVCFSYDKKGDIDRLAMPLEPRVADIVFLRRK